MIVIPIGTDNPLKRRPLVNYAIIAINIVIFIMPVQTTADQSPYDNTDSYILSARRPILHQFITYAFLHASLAHIIGNMLFLYVFGNSVNDKLGNLGYALLYLGGAVFSGIGHVLTSSSPVLGASGAVATVTGAYMVLFPKTHVFIFYWLYFFIDTFAVSALYFILFQIIWSNIISPLIGGPSNIAFTAHLAGYLYGIAIPMSMLVLKLLPHSHFDLWALTKRQHLRRQYANMTKKGSNPFTGQSPSRSVHVDVEINDSTPPSPESQKIAQLRSEIAQAANSSKLDDAAKMYLQLLELDADQVLPEQQQIDIANKLMHTGSHAPAAQAYETFIKRYSRYPFIEQIQLMLGLLYSRYLAKPTDARKHLQAALEKLTDQGQRQMCQNELERLN